MTYVTWGPLKLFKDKSPYASEIVPKQVTTLYLGSRNN